MRGSKVHISKRHVYRVGQECASSHSQGIGPSRILSGESYCVGLQQNFQNVQSMQSFGKEGKLIGIAGKAHVTCFDMPVVICGLLVLQGCSAQLLRDLPLFAIMFASYEVLHDTYLARRVKSLKVICLACARFHEAACISRHVHVRILRRESMHLARCRRGIWRLVRAATQWSSWRGRRLHQLMVGSSCRLYEPLQPLDNCCHGCMTDPTWQAMRSNDYGGASDVAHAAMGAAAGALAGALTTPLDVVRTQATMRTWGGEAAASSLSLVPRIFAEQGVRGLMAGCLARSAYMGLGAAVFFVAYENSLKSMGR